jgi:hypothetical protein
MAIDHIPDLPLVKPRHRASTWTVRSILVCSRTMEMVKGAVSTITRSLRST